MALTGMTRGLLEMRSRDVTCRVWSSLQRTSSVNSTEHSGQNSSHVQSWHTQGFFMQETARASHQIKHPPPSK